MQLGSITMAVRIPLTEPRYLDLPRFGLTQDDYDLMNNIHTTHKDELIYRPYKYPTANRVKYHSSELPIDMWDDDADFLTIDNFYELLPAHIIEHFQNYFVEEFYDVAVNPAWRGVRLYHNKPNAKGVHIHKDVYSGGGIPRLAAISIPVSANSLTSDLNFYDDELDLIETVHYKYDTPTILNTTVFHEVQHHDHSDVRKIITISTPYSIFEIMDLIDKGKVYQ